jgi:hypothetical protein
VNIKTETQQGRKLAKIHDLIKRFQVDGYAPCTCNVWYFVLSTSIP